MTAPPEDGGDGGGGGDSGPTITQWCRKNNYHEFLTAINCTDISQYEGWIAGDPELRLVFVPNFSNSTLPYPIEVRFKPSRSQVSNQWYYLTQQLHVWNLEQYGEDVAFLWHEEDSDLNGKTLMQGVASAFKQLIPQPGANPIPSGVINQTNLLNWGIAISTLAASIQVDETDHHIGTVIVNFRNCLSEYSVGDSFKFKSTTL